MTQKRSYVKVEGEDLGLIYYYTYDDPQRNDTNIQIAVKWDNQVGSFSLSKMGLNPKFDPTDFESKEPEINIYFWYGRENGEILLVEDLEVLAEKEGLQISVDILEKLRKDKAAGEILNATNAANSLFNSVFKGR